ncbi:MAG: DUF115 domain-containing protein [Candidatus Methanomethylophilaceae archaeon]|nr:DUF115 domain-containing protein [Candidatus Methanomethylophilaceae archaeon]MBQ6547828.1 DUF115 domain-containing protein [Candidatus Methanomethylophilaceae archaeon]
MRNEDWEPIYREILSDMGYDRASDENSAKVLRTLMLNADLITEDEVPVGDTVSVFGAAESLMSDIAKVRPEGTLISAGSATSTLMSLGIVPDIVVTDLDGDIDSQIEASRRGAVTLIHAHGDNIDLIMGYAKGFTGKVILTTQSKPDFVLCNFGGFTDGDRAVCFARHMGAKRILLYGFDFDNPSSKDGSDPAVKKKKLQWAKRIIGESSDIVRI